MVSSFQNKNIIEFPEKTDFEIISQRPFTASTGEIKHDVKNLKIM